MMQLVLEKVTLDEALKMIDEGQIEDAKTIMRNLLLARDDQPMDKDPQNNNERLTRQQYRQQHTTVSNDSEDEQQPFRSRVDQKIEQEQLTNEQKMQRLRKRLNIAIIKLSSRNYNRLFNFIFCKVRMKRNEVWNYLCNARRN